MRRSVVSLVAIIVAATLCASVVTAGSVLGLDAVTQLAIGGGSSAKASGTAAEQAESAWPAPKAIDWSTCTSSALAKARCGFLTVPLDWSKPNGTTIKLAVSEVVHTSSTTDYQGVMLLNPGGPGGSGLDLSLQGASVPNGVGNDYDWVGFDPRGVGSSVPKLTCDADYATGPRPAYQPDSPAVEKVWLAKAKAYAESCGKAGGALLDHMTTADTARDMEYLRMALGASTISYYGYSYGTYLGEVYSTLFPDRLKRMVLDSTVDPRGVWYEDNLKQDAAFQKTITAWFSWLASHNDTYGLGATTKAVEKTFDAEQAALAKTPADGQLGADEWSDVFLYAGYYQSYWTSLGSVFADAARGDYSELLSAYDALLEPTDDNEYAVYNAVQCTDVAWPKSFATWRADNARVAKTAPYETWPNAWYNAPCLYWPAKAQTPVKISGTKTASVLMIDQTLDAATPYEGSLYVRGLYPNASLVAQPGGTSHAVSLSGNTCVDDTIATYLATGHRPARKAGTTADATCSAGALPTP